MSKMQQTFRTTLGAALLGLALIASGCFQLETHIQLHPDGSATIKERFQLSQRLMEFQGPNGPALADALTREAVMKRMGHMGKGVTLVSCKTQLAGDGGKETLSVFRIPSIEEFQYASPYFSIPNYPGRCAVKAEMSANLKDDPHCPAGYMLLSFTPITVHPAKIKPPKPREKDAPPPPEPTPAELQVLRQLQPVFRDMLKGFKVQITLESYAAVRNAGRGRRAGTKLYDLIDVSDKDLDSFGADFFENEEIMLELEQMKLAGPNVQRHLGGAADNLTLPLFNLYLSHWWRAPPIQFQPSRHFFDRHLNGKTLDFGRGGKKAANFEDIGWKGEAGK